MSYGFQELSTLLNLQDSRLLKVRDKRFDWNKIKSELNLLQENEEINIQNPQSIHYVFGGMAPISVSLIIRMFQQNGFSSISRVLNLLAGRDIKPSPREEKEFFEQNALRIKKVLVYFIGGVTFAEIAAIRFLNRREVFGSRFKFVIATTSIISSDKCVA